jgi:hypothetical protein
MTEKQRRTKGIHVYGVEFVEASEEQSVPEKDVRRIWRQVIRHLKQDPARNTEDALGDYATYGQLKKLHDAEKRPVEGLTDDLWEAFRKIAETFVDEVA